MKYSVYLNRMLEYLQSIYQPENNVQVVVLGHQKSGTTAIGALLGRISSYGMSNDPLYMIDQGAGEVAELLMRGQKSIKNYCRSRRDLFSQNIIKDPDFIFIYPSLKRFYKNSKFIFVIRDPRDMIRSICNRLGLEGVSHKAYPDISDMKGGNHHWELILSGGLPHIKGIEQKGSNYILNLAHRWNLATEIYMNNADDISLIKYEDFLKNKEISIVKAADQMGLPCVEPITDYVDVQYQPKGDGKVGWLEFFGHENLAGIENICSNYMHMFEYEAKLSG